jgi:hypothetical protein
LDHPRERSPRGSTVGNKMDTLNERSFFETIFEVLRKIIGN